MSMLQDTFELAVVVTAIDHWTAPMKKMMDSMKYSQQNMDSVVKSMKNMGASSSEIKKVSDELDKFARNQSWSKIAKDLKDSTNMTQGQIDKIGEGYDKLAKQQEKLASSMKTTMIGAGITVAGVGMVDLLAKAAEKAGELQQAVVGVGSSMKLSNDQMQQFGNLSMTLGIPTKFSAVQTSGLLQAMYTAGLPKSQIFDKNTASQYINFADIQEYMKHENGADVVSNAVGMAHQYQLYSADQISPFLNNLNAILVQSHSTMSEFATQYNYVAGQAKRSGMSATDSLDATAWLARMGFGSGRGGTNFADFLQRSYYGSSGNKADAAMQAAGFVQNGHSVFYDDKGNFVGIPQASALMQQFYARYGGNMNKINPILQAIWGTQGGRIAGALGSQGAVDQWNMVMQNQKGTADINTMQKTMNMTLGGQWTQFKTTIEDLVQLFGQQLIPILTEVLARINDVLSHVLEFAQAHPQLLKIAAVIATIAAGAALIVGPMVALIGMIGMLSAGFELIGGVAAGVLLALPVALAAVAGGAYLLYKNWDTVKQAVKPVTDALGITTSNKDAMSQMRQKGQLRQGGAQPMDDGSVTPTPLFQQMVDKFKQTFKDMGKTSKDTWTQLVQDVKDAMDALSPYLKFIGTMLWDNFKVFLDEFAYGFKTGFDFIMDIAKLFGDSLSTVITVILDLLDGNMVKAQQDLVKGGQTFKSDILQMGGDMKGDFMQFTSVIGQDLASEAIDIAHSFVDNFGQSAAYGIDNWFQSHPTLMKLMKTFGAGGVLDAVAQPATPSGFGDPTVGHHYMMHAMGGIFSKPHLGMVAEAGTEAVIPLTKRSRGLSLWKQAGQALGVNLAGGGGGGNTIIINPHPHQNADEIADSVIRKLGGQTQFQARNSGYNLNINAMG